MIKKATFAYSIKYVHKQNRMIRKGKRKVTTRLECRIQAFIHMHYDNKENGNAASAFGIVFNGFYLPQSFFLHNFHKESPETKGAKEGRREICVLYSYRASSVFIQRSSEKIEMLTKFLDPVKCGFKGNTRLYFNAK